MQMRKPETLQPPDPDEAERLVSLESEGSETRLGASKEKDAGKGKQAWPNRHLAVTTMLVSLGGGFVFGYQLLITNPAQAAFIQFVDHSYNKTHGESKDEKTIEFIWGIIVSSFFWGATIGSLLIQTVSDRLGRKMGILVMFIIQIVACALEILSHFADNYILYSIARILLGVAISISIGIGPMFIIECSPVAVRGLVSMSTGVLLQCGLVVGSITAMPEIWGTYDLWWAIYGFELILTIAITIMLLFSKESPTYLMAKGKEDQAKNSIVYYHGITESEAEALIEAMKSDTKGEKPTTLFGIFKDKKWLCGFWVGIGIMFGTIMCGVAVVNAFAFTILLGVGLNSLQASIGNLIICIMAVVGVLTSSQFVERLGRRPLLIVTFAALAIINIFIAGFMYSFAQTGIMAIGWGVVVSCCLFNLFFAAGPGPLCFFVPGELICAKNRSATYTWLNIVMNGVRSLLLAVYFPIEDVLGPPLCYFVLFFPPCFFAVVLCYFYLPETTGLTPEEARTAMYNLPGCCGKGAKAEDGKKVAAKSKSSESAAKKTDSKSDTSKAGSGSKEGAASKQGSGEKAEGKQGSGEKAEGKQGSGEKAAKSPDDKPQEEANQQEEGKPQEEAKQKEEPKEEGAPEAEQPQKGSAEKGEEKADT